jgi:hypothetical protein
MSLTQKEHVRAFLKFVPEPQSSSSSILQDSIADEPKPHIRVNPTGNSCTFCDKRPGSGQKPRHTDRETKFTQKDAQEFAFEKIHGPRDTVADIFGEMGAPAVERAIAGKQSAIVVLGGISSDKSTIIYGSSIDAPGTPVLGLVQTCCIRAVELVNSAKETSGNVTARFFCTFVEVNANEDINDLIDPQRKCLGVRETNGRVHVDGAYVAEFKNVEELQYFVGLGMHNGSFTAVRSHRILTLEVALEKDRILQRGVIRFADVAAFAEAPRRNVSTVTLSSTPREAGGINKAVLALRSCIDSLILARPYIPWRDSKFSFLLKDCFRTDFAVSFLISVSTDSKYLSESLQLIAFGASARKIALQQVSFEAKSDKTSVIESYKREIATLQEQIIFLQSMQQMGSDSSQVQKYKERVELITKVIFFLMEPKEAQVIKDMEAPSISVEQLQKLYQFQVTRIFRDIQSSRDRNEIASLQRMIAMGQSMSISPQIKYFVSPSHWSVLACTQLSQTKAEIMFDIAEWETKFQQDYQKVNVAIKAYSVYSTQSTLPNDPGLEQFLKFIVNFMFGRLVDKKSGSLVYLLTRPATKQKILNLSENVVAGERCLKFQQHVLAENGDAVAVIAVICTWVSEFYFRLEDLRRILKSFVSAEGQLLPEQANFNANWLFSSVSSPLVWHKISKLSDLCLGNIYRSGSFSSKMLSSSNVNQSTAPLFSEAAIKLQVCLQDSCNLIVDMVNDAGRKFLAKFCVDNQLLPMEDRVVDIDLCKVSFPEAIDMCPLIQLDSFLVIFCHQQSVDLSVLTIIDTKRLQKLRCYSEAVRENRDLDHVLEILSLNESGQPSMVCLNFQNVLRRSSWVANLQRFGEILPDEGEELAQLQLSQSEGHISQAVEKFTAQSGRTETSWGIDNEAMALKLQTLETQILMQESRMNESMLANMISQPAIKHGDARAATAIETEIIAGVSRSSASHRSAANQSEQNPTVKLSSPNALPPQMEVTALAPARSLSFAASFNKPNAPIVEAKTPTAGDIIFARETVRLTSIQKAIEAGNSAIPSLRQGELLIKFNKGSSKNMERYVMLLDKTNILVWGSIDKLTSNLNLREVLGISLGMGSSTLRRAYCAEDHHTLPKLTNGTRACFCMFHVGTSFQFW